MWFVITTEIELKKAIVDLLKSRYSTKQYKYYGVEVTEGCKKPYFFTDLRLMRQRDETANIVSKQYSVTITYQGERVSEVDNFDKVEGIRKLLCCIDSRNKKRKMVLRIGDRYIKIQEYSFGYTGEANNILQIYFDVMLYDFAEPEEPKAKMHGLQIQTNIKGE